MADRRTETDPLAVLDAFLSACGFTTERRASGLRVVNPQVMGCCSLVADTIGCRARDEDQRVWFWTSWGEPIAPADRISDAALAVMAYMGERAHAPEAGR
ncbi:hypothetical protein [Actinomadura sp. 9N407]|uniref:hypothetical protein n=1 Tax=Actinomadura sp. 9N407 TaxID=3375154 RepID=UPI003792C9AE